MADFFQMCAAEKDATQSVWRDLFAFEAVDLSHLLLNMKPQYGCVKNDLMTASKNPVAVSITSF